MRRFLIPAAWCAATAYLAAVGYLLINTTFMVYDDEGYLLQGIQRFLAGDPLYDVVFSQYGPWPYLYHQIIAAVFQVSITHDVGRALTLTHWIATVLLCAAIIRRFTGNDWMAIATALLAFGYSWQMTSEPSHPGSMLTVVVMLALYTFGHHAFLKGRRVLAFVFGVLVGMAVLTKINIGFLLAAGALAGLAHEGVLSSRWKPSLRVVSVAGLVVLPWFLMASRLDDARTLSFAIQFSVAAALLHWALPPEKDAAAHSSPLAWILVGGVVALLAICGLVIAAGSSPMAIWEAVLVNPLRHPSKFMVGFSWPVWVWPITAGAVLLLATAGWEFRRRGNLTERTRWLIIIARMLAIAALAFGWRNWLTILGVGRFIALSMPLLPLFAIPLRSSPVATATGHRTRIGALAIAALPQVLHAFPVAGSQMAWGTLPLFPIFAVGLHDAIKELAAAGGEWSRRWAWASAAVLAIVVGAQCVALTSTGWSRYHDSRPLALPGAERIRIPSQVSQTLRLMTLNAAIHADVLFSRPGMFSYNLWSGVPTPTAQNATHWFWLLDGDAQQEIITRLRSTPRSAIITSDDLDAFLRQINVPVEGPLQSFVESHYKPLFRHRNLAFNIPTQSDGIVFGKGDVYTSESKETEADFLIMGAVPLSGVPTSVTFDETVPPWRSHELDPARTRVVLQAIDRAGRAAGPELTLPTSQQVQGLYRVSIFVESMDQPVSPRPGRSQVVVTLRSAAGDALAELIF